VINISILTIKQKLDEQSYLAVESETRVKITDRKISNAQVILNCSKHTMLTEVAKCAEWTKTDGRVGVLSDAASSILALHPSAHTRTAVRYSTRHTNRPDKC